MDKKYKVLPNGSILITDKFPLTEGFLTRHTQDKNNPKLFHPNFLPCKVRRFELRTLSCGNQGFRWVCGLDGSSTSIDFCAQCTKRAET